MESSLYIALYDKRASARNDHLLFCQKVCEALIFLFNNISCIPDKDIRVF